MPIPRLRRDRVALLVIDVQERLLPTIDQGEAIAHNCGVLLDVAVELGIPAVVTEQYVKGLGRSRPEIASRLRPQTALVEKTRFSAAVPATLEALHRQGRSSVLICGIEAHVCVLQTALGLLAGGRQVFLATDAISSSSPTQTRFGLRRMEQAGAVLSGALGATYELLEDASSSGFRACLALAKTLRPVAHVS